MIMAISACPMTVARDPRPRRPDREGRAQDRRPRRRPHGLQRGARRAIEDAEDDESRTSRGREEPTPARSPSENLERLKVAALERFATIRKLYARMLVGAAEGRATRRPSTSSCRKRSRDELMQIRFAAQAGRERCATACARLVDNIRQIRAQDPGPRREQGRHAAPALHQEVPGQRDVAALDRPRGRRAPQPTASSSPSYRPGDRRAAAEAARPADARDDPA